MDGDVVVDEWGLDAYVKGYRDQLHYVNGRLLQTVDEILESSAEPPIIILQGDHGPRSHVHASELAKTDVRELFPILNAYYLPHGGAAIIPQDISPVNTFRMILNYYFHYGFDRLPDESYYHPHRDASKFTRVTDRVRTPVAVPDTLVP